MSDGNNEKLKELLPDPGNDTSPKQSASIPPAPEIKSDPESVKMPVETASADRVDDAEKTEKILEKSIIDKDYFLLNCKKMMKFGLFWAGFAYLQRLPSLFLNFNKIEQLLIHQCKIYCMIKMKEYSQAQKMCKELDFLSEVNKFESQAEKFPGLKGSMISLPLAYFDAVMHFLIERGPAQRMMTLHKLNQLLLEVKLKQKNKSLDANVGIIQNMSESERDLFSQYFTMFGLFPNYADYDGQIKVLTLEIVKIHMIESEHRVSHLILKNLCEQYPSDPYLWNTLGKLYLEIGKKTQAESAFEKTQEAIMAAVSSGKSSTELAEFVKAFNQGLVRVFDGQYEEAIELFKKSLTFKPYMMIAYNNIGVCSMMKMNFPQAIEHLEGIVKEDPNRNFNLVLLQNLKSLYECSSADQKQRKESMRDFLSKNSSKECPYLLFSLTEPNK